MMDITALQKIIDGKPPTIKEWETTLFDIAGFPHYENVISNVYAYFPDSNEKNGLNNLLLDTLQSFIGTDFKFESVEIHREYTVIDQKSIDIVITNRDSLENVIIIENMMFHHLNNDLEKYYNFFKINDQDKQGIVLTLSTIDTNHKHFDNITHQQWVNAIWNNIGVYLVDLPDTTRYHLKQFSKT